MSLQKHDASAGSKVPNSSVGVEAAAGRQGSVPIEFHVENGSRVTLLMQNLLAHFQIPETPGLVVTGGAQKTPGGMPGEARNAVGSVA